MTTLEHQDREADAFARELLMPVNLLRASVKKLKGAVTDQDVERLAREYQVPVVQMFLRLVHLKLIRPVN